MADGDTSDAGLQANAMDNASLGTLVSHAVVGFNGSAASYDAVAFAAGWAKRTGGALDIVYVADPYWQRIGDACGGMASPFYDLRDMAPVLSEDAAEAMAESGVSWVYRTICLATAGGVARELERHATTLSADAIFIGCPRRRRRSSIPRRLLRCPKQIVIIVP
jgi:nucleotide-binding universal stress UspA family protein